MELQSSEYTEFLEVMTRVNRAKQHVSKWHDNIQRWRDLYSLNHYNNLRARRGETQYSDPTHTNTVDLSVGIMLGNQMRWHSYGINASHQEQKDTSKLEKLMDSIISVNNEREEKNNVYELFMDFNRDGGGVIYSVFDPDLAKAAITAVDVVENDAMMTVKAYAESPIRMQVIDPIKFFALPGGPRRWLMVGRRESMTVLDVETLYDVRLSDFAHLTPEMKSGTFGEFIDAWDYVTVTESDAEGNILGKKLGVRNTVTFNNKPVLGPRLMPGYEELPYTVQFFKPAGAEPQEWQSIMTPLESSVKLLEKTVNRRAHQIDVFTGLPIVSKTQPGRAVQVDPGLFNLVSLSTDESIEFPTWPGNAPDVQMHIDFLRTRVNQSGFSDVMFGSGSSQMAGYAMSQLGDQNRIRLEQPISHIELLLTVWAKKAIKLLSTFASDSYLCVYGHRYGKAFQDYIKVQDLSGYGIAAEIRPDYPSEDSRKAAMASQVKGILSNYTIMEKYLDVEQPDDEESRKLIEMATFNPITIQYALIKEMSDRAKEGDVVAQMTIQSLLAGGLPGQPGRPGEGPAPAQGPGQPTPSGELTRQEQGGQPYGQSANDQQNAMVQHPSLT